MMDWNVDWASFVSLIANLFGELFWNLLAAFLWNINAVLNWHLNRNLFTDIFASLLGYISADSIGNFLYNINTGFLGNLATFGNCNLTRNLNGNLFADWNIDWPAFWGSITISCVDRFVAVPSLGVAVTTSPVSSISLIRIANLKKKMFWCKRVIFHWLSILC